MSRISSSSVLYGVAVLVVAGGVGVFARLSLTGQASMTFDQCLSSLCGRFTQPSQEFNSCMASCYTLFYSGGVTGGGSIAGGVPTSSAPTQNSSSLAVADVRVRQCISILCAYLNPTTADFHNCERSCVQRYAEDGDVDVKQLSCGDGLLQSREECDDGNRSNGDGCSAVCKLELHFPSRCGDGRLDTPELCDDGNVSDGDGCNHVCAREFSCGNGLKEPPSEECDDGNLLGLDGCSANCVVEDSSVASLCGNGIREVGEVCDDGNTIPGDGCSSSCLVEDALENVTSSPSVLCGNGLVEGGEGCDDGNTLGLDGCSVVCQLERGETNRFCYTASGEKSVLREQCGTREEQRRVLFSQVSVSLPFEEFEALLDKLVSKDSGQVALTFSARVQEVHDAVREAIDRMARVGVSLRPDDPLFLSLQSHVVVLQELLQKDSAEWSEDDVERIAGVALERLRLVNDLFGKEAPKSRGATAVLEAIGGIFQKFPSFLKLLVEEGEGGEAAMQRVYAAYFDARDLQLAARSACNGGVGVSSEGCKPALSSVLQALERMRWMVELIEGSPGLQGSVDDLFTDIYAEWVPGFSRSTPDLSTSWSGHSSIPNFTKPILILPTR